MTLQPYHNILGGVYLIDESGAALGLINNAGSPQICAQDYLQALAEGDISGHTTWSKIGYTPSLVTATDSDLWSKGGKINFPASAMRIAVASSAHAFDTSAGAGAREVTVKYLDANYTEKSEVIAMAGTAWVNSVASDVLRVNSFRVTAAGSSACAVGNIILVDSATKAIAYTFITAGFTRARNSAYTVPAGKFLYVVSWTASYGFESNSTNYARLFTRATQNDGVRVPGIFFPYTEIICSNNTTFMTFPIPTRLEEKVDIKVSGISTYAGVAFSSLRGWLEPL